MTQAINQPKQLPHMVLAEHASLEETNLLLPYQTLPSIKMMTAEVCFIEKSRRIGITWALASEAVLIAASNKQAGGMDVFYIGYNLEMTREFIDTCASWAKAFTLAANDVEEWIFKDDNDKEAKAFRITMESGFEIVALTSNPRSLRGRQGFVIIDEGAFHDDLKELIDAAMALTMWGGKIIVISTHFGADNVFNEYIKQIKDGDLKYAHIKIDFDDALRDGLYKRICLVQGKEWTQKLEDEYRDKIVSNYGKAADQELFCVPSNSHGAYLSSALVESRQDEAPVLRLRCEDNFVYQAEIVRRATIEAWCKEHILPVIDKLDPALRHFLGEDFGRSGDLTILWINALTALLVKQCRFMVELRNVPFQQQKQILWYVLDRLPRFEAAAMDARGNGQQLAEETMQRYGALRIHTVMITTKFYMEAVPPYKAALEDGTATVPRDKDVVNDHRAVVMINGVASIPDSKNKGADGYDRHADSFIAAVMAHWAATQPYRTYEYEGLGRKEHKNNMRPDHSDDLPNRSSRFTGRGAY